MNEHAPDQPTEEPTTQGADQPTVAPATSVADQPTVGTAPQLPAPRRLVTRTAWVTALVVGLAAGGVGFGIGSASSSEAAPTATALQLPPGASAGNPWGEGFAGGTSGGAAQGGTSGGTSDTTGTTQAQTEASDAQETGVVTIDSVIDYGTGEAAGTGIVLTSKGEILTNNHVISGATTITVTVASTGTDYTATVVGTDATHDVAVLQLTGASGLAVADLDADGVTTGEAVTAVGNGGGTGTVYAAAGTVTATSASITAQSEGSSASEDLTGLIQTDADVVAGYSGGPLLDADGEVIGIDTAASSGSADVEGYAIPIATARTIAAQIEAGTESGTVSIGLPAFLGVQVSGLASASSSGALLAGVLDGSPAADAGLAAGDTVTAVGGTSVTSADSLSTAIAAHEPGQSVSVTWVDSAGASHTAQVTLTQGPAA